VFWQPISGTQGPTSTSAPGFQVETNNCIAFFEWPEAGGFHKPAGQPARGKVQFDHVSCDVETEEELLELQAGWSRLA